MTDTPRPDYPPLDYPPEAVAACEKALRSLLTKIGPWGTLITLVGGLVPRYLVPNAPDGVAPHIGSVDVDIVVGVAVDDSDAEAYRTLHKNLQEAGFEPSRDLETGNKETFRWERRVDGIRVLIEFFCPVGPEGQPGRLRRNPSAKVGAAISAIQLRGAELAARDYLVVHLSGDTLDRGGIREGVELRVANVLPFLVLKAIALAERDKQKDAYDIVWLLMAYGARPGDIARVAAASPVLGAPEVVEAIDLLTREFRTSEHSGPARYAAFMLAQERLSPESDPEAFARLRRDGFAVMREFLAAWDQAGLPGAIGKVETPPSEGA